MPHEDRIAEEEQRVKDGYHLIRMRLERLEKNIVSFLLLIIFLFLSYFILKFIKLYPNLIIGQAGAHSHQEGSDPQTKGASRVRAQRRRILSCCWFSRVPHLQKQPEEGTLVSTWNYIKNTSCTYFRLLCNLYSHFLFDNNRHKSCRSKNDSITLIKWPRWRRSRRSTKRNG